MPQIMFLPSISCLLSAAFNLKWCSSRDIFASAIDQSVLERKSANAEHAEKSPRDEKNVPRVHRPGLHRRLHACHLSRRTGFGATEIRRPHRKTKKELPAQHFDANDDHKNHHDDGNVIYRRSKRDSPKRRLFYERRLRSEKIFCTEWVNQRHKTQRHPARSFETKQRLQQHLKTKRRFKWPPIQQNPAPPTTALVVTGAGAAGNAYRLLRRAAISTALDLLHSGASIDLPKDRSCLGGEKLCVSDKHHLSRSFDSARERIAKRSMGRSRYRVILRLDADDGRVWNFCAV